MMASAPHTAPFPVPSLPPPLDPRSLPVFPPSRCNHSRPLSRAQDALPLGVALHTTIALHALQARILKSALSSAFI